METIQAVIRSIKFSGYKIEIGTNIKNKPTAKLSQYMTRGKNKDTWQLREHYYFNSEERRQQWIKEKITNINANVKADIERKEATRKANAEVNASDYYKVNDVIVNTWGYEQTNVYFYQVVEVKNKTILIKEIYCHEEKDSMYSHGMACNVLPSLNCFKDNGDTYLLRVKAEGRLSSPESYYYMHKWDGRPEYKSWYY